MLNPLHPRGTRPATRPRTQRGVVLFLALIMIVVLMLAGLALVRSVSTTNVIAGNLAFKQAATNSADTGIEAAIAWLEANNNATTLGANQTGAVKYLAARQDPAAGQSWDAFWNSLPATVVNTMAADASDNTVSYVIHRLCNATGPSSTAGCSAPPNFSSSEGSSRGAGVVALKSDPQVYYRITARVAGPRGTVSYVQAVVAL
jgi:Tfp pilus assembly protein PilX